MRILQAPFTFHPDPIGGTEVYVEALARHLQRAGAQVAVAAPGGRNEEYRHEGIPVYRFASAATDLKSLYGGGDEQAAKAFGCILDQERPDIVHMHALTPAVSVRIVRQAKQRGIPVIFTYHTPTVNCQRGTLLRWGKKVCDGRLDVDLCARCALNGLGLPRGLADAVGRVPISVGQALASIGLSGGVWTALRMRQLISVRLTAVRALFAETDHMVAVCAWVQDLLERNGVPLQKITLSPQGLMQEVRSEHRARCSEDPSSEASVFKAPGIRLAFLGRMDPVKGAHLLIRAIRQIPQAHLSLDLYGVVQGSREIAYLKRLRSMAGADSRITFREPIAAADVVDCLKGYDLLAVPSQWLETGPLVVLEAFAAGIPVIASNLGGIPELVQDGVNGLLVQADSEAAWAQRLREVCNDRNLVLRLGRAVPAPKGMDTVASEMSALYRKLLDSR